MLPAALVGYAVIAVVYGWWLSAGIAPLVAWLLWRRHARARFTAYIFLSVLAVRAALTASWPLGLFAVGVIAALQLPDARRAWPRLAARRPWARMPP
jgi:hypothetical protein